MISETLKIKPELDKDGLAKMEKTLGERFKKLAKSFGKGLASAFKGGGIVGLALGLLDKLLNPLKEIQEAIDRTLQKAGGIATNAQQFGSTSGRLAKLQALGEAKGIDADSLYMLIGKFQSAVADAQANPNQPSAVKNFVNDKDMVNAFFEFIQSLQRLDKNQQIRAQEAVFGEKQVLKMASFLQADFSDLMKQVAPQDTNKLTARINKLDTLSNLADTLAARRSLQDLSTKGGVINESMVRAKDRAEGIALEKENKNIAAYENLAAISNTVAKIEGLAQQGLSLLGDLVNKVTPTVNRIANSIDNLMKSPAARGIFKMFGKGE